MVWCALASSASAVSTGDASFTIDAGPWNNGMNPTRQGLTIIGTTRARTDIVHSHVLRVQSQELKSSSTSTCTPLASPSVVHQES
jgi:hypothetical protein